MELIHDEVAQWIENWDNNSDEELAAVPIS